MGFSATTTKNYPQFLAGKSSVIQALDKEVLGLSLNAMNTIIERILSQEEDSIILDCTSCAEEEVSIMHKEKEEEEESGRKEKEKKEQEARERELGLNIEERERRRREEAATWEHPKTARRKTKESQGGRKPTIFASAK